MVLPAPAPARRQLLLDNNVVVSALLWGGRPRHLLDLALDAQVVLVTSASLLAELRHTLSYPKLAKRLVLLNTSVDAMMQRAYVTGTASWGVPSANGRGG